MGLPSGRTLSPNTSSATKNIPYSSAVMEGHACVPADVYSAQSDVGGPKERSLLSGFSSLDSLDVLAIEALGSIMLVCCIEKASGW